MGDFELEGVFVSALMASSSFAPRKHAIGEAVRTLVMTTITLPPDVERSLLEAARQLGITPESLAVDALRQALNPIGEESRPANLLELLGDYVGGIDGSSEAWSENCGERFADGLAEQHQQVQP